LSEYPLSRYKEDKDITKTISKEDKDITKTISKDDPYIKVPILLWKF